MGASPLAPLATREITMSEYRCFLMHKLLIVGVNLMMIAALSIAMYRASLFPDDFTPTFFVTFFSLFLPIAVLGFMGKRILRRKLPT